MGIGAQLINFFMDAMNDVDNVDLNPKSLADFLKQTDEKPIDIHLLVNYCNKLIEKGFLIHAGYDPKNPLVLGNHYYFMGPYDKNLSNYGTFDFAIFGFSAIRQHFEPSVAPIVVQTREGTPDIGTCFLTTSRRIITARHCVENMQEVEIPGWDMVGAPLIDICVPNKPSLDVAILRFAGNPLPAAPEFWFQKDANILDEVLTMGYPPILGFDSVQIAEVGQISAFLSSSTGRIVAAKDSYLDKQDYFLINARVKGGNSGGPVVDNLGRVIGIVSSAPADATGQMEQLGYGAVIPASQILSLTGPNDFHRLPFEYTAHGFCTL